jgi:c-di-GMP-binding flagellar brake protein YcgR
MAAQPEAAREDRQAGKSNGPNRRGYPRHDVDCAVVVSAVSGSTQIEGRLTDLSLGGCRVVTEQRYSAGIPVRVEVQFQLRGVAFRFAGVIVGSREARCFAVRFLDVSVRRREELAEVLAEVAQANSAGATAPSAPSNSTEAVPEAPAVAVPAFAQAEPSAVPDAGAAVSVGESASTPTAPASSLADRRLHRRHGVDTSVRLLLINAGICMPGRIVNLSLGGCRIRMQEQFMVGIYVRVEAEFYLHGLPFRVGGVSQAILDKNTIGVRFLDISARRREQLMELMAEFAESEAFQISAGETAAADGPYMVSPAG